MKLHLIKHSLLKKWFYSCDLMLFLADTCFLNHMQDLTQSNIYDFRPLMARFRWAITPDVQEELNHFNMSDFFPNPYIIPVTVDEITKTRERYPILNHFDLADQSLIVAVIREGGVVLSDDGELLMECVALGIPAMNLPVFCLGLVKSDLISKTDYSDLIKFWELHHRYRKKNLKNWKKQLQLL